MFMHHIALCTPSIILFNCGHLLYIRVDHTEPGPEVQVEQAQAEEFANLALDQSKLWCI
jgi:hypothetical protein